MDSLTTEQKEQKAAEGKKKKSTFRITSIIDPVKNDDDEDDDKENDEDETEEKTTASRFRVIKSQTPNPRTFFSGRWKVREMYLMELSSNHKEPGKEPPQTSRGTSGTSYDSTGDNTRCATPQSSSSLSFTEEPSVPTFSIPKLDTSHLESFENQVSNHLKKSKEEMVALHLLSSSINMKYEKLKEEHEKIRRENHSLKEEIRRLRSR